MILTKENYLNEKGITLMLTFIKAIRSIRGPQQLFH
jgi:hypothetical protein